MNYTQNEKIMSITERTLKGNPLVLHVNRLLRHKRSGFLTMK
ncbi:MAG TPA: hypothetical protein VFD57_07075 [Clostridia bacterium]|nr:hypothetical protein [Clostridia bacterium]